MKVLVLGGNGYIGQYIVSKLKSAKNFNVTIASRAVSDDSDNVIKLDATNLEQLQAHMIGYDIVVNCITGTGDTIVSSALAIVEAASKLNQPYIVHLSTQSVYGSQEGILDESTDLKDDLGWYGQAKIKAENSMQEYAENGGSASVLRIGCVLGMNSPLWHKRFEYWLSSGLLGDLGEYGDGWSNIVDVEDIASTVHLLCLSRPVGLKFYNLSAPDSPRWNQYIIDLGIRLGYEPVKKKSYRLLKLKIYLFGIPQKIVQHILKKANIKSQFGVNGFPPSLLSIFQQELKLNSSLVSKELGLKFTPYDKTLSKLTREALRDE